MSTDYMLTTVDNPYNPFEQFVPWYQYDVDMGYNTCSHLARIVKLSDDLSEKEIDEAIDAAMDEIIKYDPLGIYQKVSPSQTETNETTGT